MLKLSQGIIVENEDVLSKVSLRAKIPGYWSGTVEVIVTGLRACKSLSVVLLAVMWFLTRDINS
jgi:hypothetical protein